MARTIPVNENVLRSFQNIPKFGGLQKDEKARINAFEFAVKKDGSYGPWSEWIHNLTAPAIEEQRGAESVTVKERKWFGTFLCLGDAVVLNEKGADPERCPACQMAEMHDAFRPDRRHATNIFRYSILSGKFDIREPWGIEVLPWTFSERVFKRLTELFDRFDQNLAAHDLLIVCEVPRFQNYQIDADSKAAWLLPEHNTEPYKYGQSFKSLVAQVVKESKLSDDDLSAILGIKAAPATLSEKVRNLAGELGLLSGGVPVSHPAAPMHEQVSADEISEMLGGGAAPGDEVASNGATTEAAGEDGTPAPAAGETATTSDDAVSPPAPPAPAPAAAPLEQQSIEDLLA